MPIPVNCKTCNYSGHAADSESGKIARCPKCNHLIHIPDVTWVGGIAKEQEPPPFIPPLDEVAIVPPAKEPKHRSLITNELAITWIKRGMIAVSALMFLATLHRQGMAGFSHYLSLTILASFGFYKLLKYAPEAWRRYGTIAAVVLSLVVWFKVDYSIHYWEDANETSDELNYTDYYARGADSPYFREYRVWYKEGGYYYSAGSFSESMKQHGEWKSHSNGLRPTSSWYWYGEEITEGEWHLRRQK